MRTRPLAALIAEEPPAITSLVGDGLLVPGGSLAIYGPSEIYKSFATLQLCIALAEGRPWLGYPVHTRIPTHYIQAEITEFKMRERALALLHDSVGVGGLVSYSPAEDFVLDSLTARKELLGVVEEGGAQFVVLDPISYFFYGGENSDEVVKYVLKSLSWVSARLAQPCGWGWVHHSNKGLWLGTKVVDRGFVDMSGHSWLNRWPDTIGHLTKVADSDMVELRWEKVRHGEKPPPRWLHFNKKKLMLEVAEQDPAMVVLELVEGGPRPVGVVDEVVAERCGISVRKVWGIRKRMVEQGILQEIANPANKTQKLVERQ